MINILYRFKFMHSQFIKNNCSCLRLTLLIVFYVLSCELYMNRGHPVFSTCVEKVCCPLLLTGSKTVYIDFNGCKDLIG